MRPLSQPALAALFAAALIGSFFLPLLVVPLVTQITPLDALRQIGIDGLADLDPAVQAFFASFPLAALVLVLALVRACPNGLALAAGALPIGVTIWAALNLNDSFAQLGLPIRASDITDFLGAGAWLYVGAGVALALLSMADRRRP